MKLVLTVNNRKYVVDPGTADEVFALLAGAERYDTKYNRADNGDHYYTHHVWTEERPEALVNVEAMPQANYVAAKALGKP